MKIRPEQFSRIGEFYLEKAILDILLEAKHKQQCIGAAKISERAGIFRDRGKVNIMNDAITTGMLVKLNDQGKVKRCKQSKSVGGWELTDDEFKRRRKDEYIWRRVINYTVIRCICSAVPINSTNKRAK